MALFLAEASSQPLVLHSARLLARDLTLISLLGSELITAVANNWQCATDSGAIRQSNWEKIKIEDAVAVRIIP